MSLYVLKKTKFVKVMSLLKVFNLCRVQKNQFQGKLVFINIEMLIQQFFQYLFTFLGYSYSNFDAAFELVKNIRLNAEKLQFVITWSKILPFSKDNFLIL